MNNQAQLATSIASVLTLVVLIAIGAIMISQTVGQMNPDNAEHSVERSIRETTENSNTSFNLLSISAITVIAAVLICLFFRSSKGAFGS